jgi:hypothetical protein
MRANQEIPERKRRSSEEIKRLVLEFETSGLRQNEFCRNHGLALSTLQRQLKRRRLENGEAKAWGELSRAESSRLVAVELARRDQDGNSRPACALKMVLASGRRIEGRISIRTPSNDW